MMKKIIDFAITKTNRNNILLIHTMVQIDLTETKTKNDATTTANNKRWQKLGSKASESLLILLVCLFIVKQKTVN